MSPAFIGGIGDHLSGAEITFERYHLIAELNKAVDEVRKGGERKVRPELLLRAKQVRVAQASREPLHSLGSAASVVLSRPSARLGTARAWRWRWDFDGFYNQPPELSEKPIFSVGIAERSALGLHR